MTPTENQATTTIYKLKCELSNAPLPNDLLNVTTFVRQTIDIAYCQILRLAHMDYFCCTFVLATAHDNVNGHPRGCPKSRAVIKCLKLVFIVTRYIISKFIGLKH